MTIRKLLVASLLALASGLAAAQQEAITPLDDITPIKLAGGDVAMLHTRTDLNNAHPVDTVSFFKRSVSGPAEHIPFELDGDFQPFLSLRSGADCAVSGVRAFRQGDSLQIVYAMTKGGSADKKPVTFLVFELARNAEGAPGTPPLYFKQQYRMVSKQSYCDVNLAFEKEMPLPATDDK